MDKFLKKQKGNAIAFLMIAAAAGLALFLSGYLPTQTASTRPVAQQEQQAHSNVSGNEIRTDGAKPTDASLALTAKTAETAPAQPEKQTEIKSAKLAKHAKSKKIVKRKKTKSSGKTKTAKSKSGKKSALSAAKAVEPRLAEEVYDLTQGFTRAFDDGNLNDFLSFFSKSATENNILTYDRIRETYGDLFEKRLYRFQYSIGNTVIREKEKRVIVSGVFVMKGQDGDGTDRTKKGTLTMTLERENGKFKIKHLQKKFE